jgi:glycosyltransferase involved in cell wall biosynthesis
LKRADLYVLSSRCEGTPRVLLEAAAAGVPRIGSNTDGIPKCIFNEYDGLLFESENVMALQAAMTRMLSDEEMREKFAKNAFDRIYKHFTPEIYARDLHSHFKMLFSKEQDQPEKAPEQEEQEETVLTG